MTRQPFSLASQTEQVVFRVSVELIAAFDCVIECDDPKFEIVCVDGLATRAVLDSSIGQVQRQRRRGGT